MVLLERERLGKAEGRFFKPLAKAHLSMSMSSFSSLPKLTTHTLTAAKQEAFFLFEVPSDQDAMQLQDVLGLHEITVFGVKESEISEQRKVNKRLLACTCLFTATFV